MTLWPKLAGYVLGGNLLMGRSFAYIGSQSLKLFIGEAFIGLHVLCHPRQTIGRLCVALASPTPLTGFAWSFFLFFAYGIFELIRGILLGFDPIVSVQTLVFNCYPIVVLVGICIGEETPHYLRRFVLPFAWIHGIYGVAYILYLSRVTETIPGSPWVPLFGQPTGAALVLIGLICYKTNLRVSLLPIMLNAFVLLGMQVRAEWLAFFVALILRSVLNRNFEVLLKGSALVVALLIIGVVTDFSIPGTSRRGGTISARFLVARAIAPVDEELAAEYRGTRNSNDVKTYEWREIWWRDIRREIHRSWDTTLFGFGYGFALTSITRIQTSVPGAPIRTPHSVFYYALGFSGWIGVVLFFALQFFILRSLYQGYKLTGDNYGLVACCGLFAWAFFDAAFESPYRAIPYYLIAGISFAPVLQRSTQLWMPLRLLDRSAVVTN